MEERAGLSRRSWAAKAEERRKVYVGNPLPILRFD
jgi:hypothetical protein